MDGLDAEGEATDFVPEYCTENVAPEHLPARDSSASPYRSIPMQIVLHDVVDSEWTHLHLRIELHLPLVFGTPLEEQANSHVHECTCGAIVSRKRIRNRLAGA